MKKSLTWRKKDWLYGYLFIAPLCLGLLIFYIWPFLQNAWFSFNDVNTFNVTTFVGLENYKKLLSDAEIGKAFLNSLKYVVFTVPIGLFLSLIIAALLNTNIKAQGIYRTLYFLPSITMSAAVAMVWKWIYNEQMGVLNALLRKFGLEGHNWLTDSKSALYCIMLVAIWMGVGYNMVILLAGMQNVPQSFYEAAKIDGGGPVKCFFKITLPLISPTIFFVLITGVIGGFQVFDIIYMMIGNANPAFYDTQTVVMLYYKQAFEYGQKGYAACIALFIFLVIMLVTAIQLYCQKKWVNY